MTLEQVVEVEIERFCSAMGLSPEQKARLSQFLAGEYAELLDFMQRNSGISRDDLLQRLEIISSSGRDQLAQWLSPEQVSTWEREMAKTKDLLCDKLAA